MFLPLSAVIPLLILIGFSSAVLASMIGLGGGLVAIPLIILLLGAGQSTQATLIAYVSIFALSLFSLIKYLTQKKRPDWKKSSLIALGLVPITAISKIYLGPLISSGKQWFGIGFIIIIVLAMILVNSSSKIKVKLPLWSLPFFGGVIGIAAGTMGISGGVFVIPLLVIGAGMSMKEAAVNGIFLTLLGAMTNILVASINVGDGGYVDMQTNHMPIGHGAVPWYLTLVVIAGSIPGSLVGPYLSKKWMNSKRMKMMFNITMGVLLVWEIIHTILLVTGVMQ